MKKLLLATDAWSPQTNGVVRTLQMTTEHLQKLGCETKVIHPGLFSGVAFPLYPDIKVCLPPVSTIRRIIKDYCPDYIHIATEGTIGYAVRHVCKQLKINFTTSYHTNLPEYGWRMWWVPTWITYRYLRWFHSDVIIMVATHRVRDNLKAHGFTNRFAMWSRGVDTSLFHPRPKKLDWIRPILMYVGRVSREKNLEAFLDIDFSGTKVVVGNGPYREYLMEKYKSVKFVPFLQGEELAQMYAEADVFVFPSQTDTFGLVMLEALASGVPVAALPVCSEVLPQIKGTGCINKDLRFAMEVSLKDADPNECVRFVKNYYTWEKCSKQFLRNLERVKS